MPQAWGLFLTSHLMNCNIRYRMTVRLLCLAAWAPGLLFSPILSAEGEHLIPHKLPTSSVEMAFFFSLKMCHHPQGAFLTQQELKSARCLSISRSLVRQRSRKLEVCGIGDTMSACLGPKPPELTSQNCHLFYRATALPTQAELVFSARLTFLECVC